MITGIIATVEKASLAMMLRARGEDTTFHLTTTKSIDLRAALSKPETRKAEGDVVIIESKKWDWICNGNDLLDPVTGDAFEPKRGQIIEREDGTKYRLVPGEGSELLFRWSSGVKCQMRIHCEEF